MNIINLLNVSSAILVFARCISIPFLAIYLGREFNFSPIQIGSYLGFGLLIGSIANFLLNIYLHGLSKKKIILSNIFLVGLLFVWSYSVKDSLVYFFIYTTITGLSFYFDTFIKSILSDLRNEDKCKQQYATRFVMINLGFGAGALIPSLCGLVAEPIVFVWSGIIYLFVGILFIIFFPKSIKYASNLLENKTDSGINIYIKNFSDLRLVFFTINSILNYIVFGRYQFYLSQFVVENFDNGENIFVYLIVLNTLLIILFQNLLYSKLKSIELVKLIIWGEIFLALAEVTFAFSSQVINLFLGIILFTIGQMIIIPAESEVISQISPIKDSSSYFGIQSIANIGSFIGIFGSGFLLERYGSMVMFLFLGLLPILNALCFKCTNTIFYHRNSY